MRGHYRRANLRKPVGYSLYCSRPFPTTSVEYACTTGSRSRRVTRTWARPSCARPADWLGRKPWHDLCLDVDVDRSYQELFSGEPAQHLADPLGPDRRHRLPRPRPAPPRAVHVIRGRVRDERLKIGASPPGARVRPRRDVHDRAVGDPPRAPRRRRAGADRARLLPAAHCGWAPTWSSPTAPSRATRSRTSELRPLEVARSRARRPALASRGSRPSASTPAPAGRASGGGSAVSTPRIARALRPRSSRRPRRQRLRSGDGPEPTPRPQVESSAGSSPGARRAGASRSPRTSASPSRTAASDSAWLPVVRPDGESPSRHPPRASAASTTLEPECEPGSLNANRRPRRSSSARGRLVGPHDDVGEVDRPTAVALADRHGRDQRLDPVARPHVRQPAQEGGVERAVEQLVERPAVDQLRPPDRRGGALVERPQPRARGRCRARSVRSGTELDQRPGDERGERRRRQATTAVSFSGLRPVGALRPSAPRAGAISACSSTSRATSAPGLGHHHVARARRPGSRARRSRRCGAGCSARPPRAACPGSTRPRPGCARRPRAPARPRCSADRSCGRARGRRSTGVLDRRRAHVDQRHPAGVAEALVEVVAQRARRADQRAPSSLMRPRSAPRRPCRRRSARRARRRSSSASETISVQRSAGTRPG